MPVANRVTAHELGDSFAQAVRQVQAARRLWVRHHRDYIELWLLTDATDADTERRLYEASATLRERFPDANFRLHIVNPRFLDDVGDPANAVPAGAEESPLRPE